MRTLDGRNVKLSELRRDERRTASGAVVLSFWSATCRCCRDVEHLLAKLAKEYGGRAAVLALDANETAEGLPPSSRRAGRSCPSFWTPAAARPTCSG